MTMTAPTQEQGTGKLGKRLTRRELQVLTMLRDGQDLTQIAANLDMSLHTVRGHVKHMLAKLGVHSQLQAVIAGIERGIIPPIKPEKR